MNNSETVLMTIKEFQSAHNKPRTRDDVVEQVGDWAWDDAGKAFDDAVKAGIIRKSHEGQMGTYWILSDKYKETK